MHITYTYRIIKVDPPARCMEIVYESEGRQTMHIGARLPYEGEALEDIVQAFAPVRYWEEQEIPVVAPKVGATGVIVVSPPPEPVAPAPIEQPVVVGAQEL